MPDERQNIDKTGSGFDACFRMRTEPLERKRQMSQDKPNTRGYETMTSRERIENRIGKELAQKYRDIEALLALLDYRFKKGVERDNDLEFGLIWVFFFDTLHGKKAASRIIAGILAPVQWCATRIKYAFREKAERRLAFSNTFLWNRRYPIVREQIEEKTGCTAVLSFYDTIKRSSPNAKEMLHDTLRLNSGSVRPVYIPRYSIAGAGLQRAVTNYYQLLFRKLQGKDDVPEEALDQALARLRKTYWKRVGYLTKKLKKEDLELYATINQYNLRDLLLIHACKNLGIPTMELEHHAMEFARARFDPEVPQQRLSFVSHYGYWSATERLFHEKVFRYDNLLYPPDQNRYLVSGNAEMSYEQAVAYQKQYPVQRKLTFMTSGIEADTLSREVLERYEKWRWAVFNGLRELAGKQNLQICLRYTPFREQYFREKEIPTLKEWGFRISASVPENLMEDMCSSMAVMSSASSVLATARLMGKMIYRVEDMDIPYIHVDDRVHEVSPEGIRDLAIPETGDTQDQIDPAGFFDIERVLASL